MTSVKDRLIEFIKSNNMGQAVFERRVGLSNGFVNNIGDSIRKTSLEKIRREFPDLNPSWLIVGEGEMLLSEDQKTRKGSSKEAAALKKEIAELTALLQEKDRLLAQKDEMIEALKNQLLR